MRAGSSTLRVLVVEDSPAARRLLVHIIDGDPEMEVVGEASDGNEAVELTHGVQPDVILMDIVLPGMDGLEATRTIMRDCPTPIVLTSAGYRSSDATKTFEALASGALTVLPKPQGPGSRCFADEVANLTTTLKLMSEVKLVRRRPPVTGRSSAVSRAPTTRLPSAPVRVVAVAASTGGPAALATVLGSLPGSTPAPILVVQHITPGFHDGLVAWLDSVTPLSVRLAEEGERLRPGTVLVAPPEKHLGVSEGGRVALSTDPPIRGHRPSATHLFRSVGRVYGSSAIGVILTGMGDDGTDGLQSLKQAGGMVVAQDQASSVVYGMPREPAVRGIVDNVVAIDLVGRTLNDLMNGGRR